MNRLITVLQTIYGKNIIICVKPCVLKFNKEDILYEDNILIVLKPMKE